MTKAGIGFTLILGIGCLAWTHSARAATGWVCAETPQNQSPMDKAVRRAVGVTGTEIQKYDIQGKKLETVPDNSTVINGIQMFLSSHYQIITNNSIGLVAILTDAKNYPSGPQVWVDVIIIDKTRDIIEHFSGSTTERNGNVETGPCTPY